MFKKIFNFNTPSSILSRGNAMIMLVVFMAVGLIVTTATITLVMVNSMSASKYQLGQEALSVAESGIENALLRLLRDPSYVGETLIVDNGSVITTVSGAAVKTIRAEGEAGTIQRTIEVVIDTSGGLLSIISWREIF